MTTKSKRSRSSSLPADVLMVLPELGVEVLSVKGDEAWAFCPGPHAKRTGAPNVNTPSWSVNILSGQHSCFSCGWGGPFVTLVKYVEDMDDSTAEKWIKDHGGMEYVKNRLSGQKSYEKKQAEEVTEARLIMFDDPPKKALDSRDIDLGSALAYGVRWNPERMKVDDHHTVPADTWILPIRDPFDDHLMGWQEKGKGYFNNYPKNVEKSLTIFGYPLLQPGAPAYVYESPLDPVRMHSYGLEGAVSTYGVHVSDTQVALLADRTEHVVWCLDNDGPGRSKERAIFNEHRHKFRKMFFTAYDPSDLKDHGEMNIEDVQWSLDNAISKMRFRP